MVVIIVIFVGLPGSLNLPPQHHCGGALSLPHLRTGILPLLVGAPEAIAISGGEARGPERQRVYAAIALARGDVGRARDAGPVVEPGRTPFASTLFDGGDDLCGDAGIDVGALDG